MYNKRGHVNLETSASFHNRLDTNLAFFSTDLGTADLVFNITRNKSPLLVSEENASTLLILMKGDEYIVQEVEYVDPMNGQLKVTVDDKVLARPGKWRGQIYIEVHDVNNPSKEDIVTQAEFTFDIKDSVINTIPAIDKLNEIRTFIDFREEIMETISEINTALENGEDYVSQMEATKASGMKALNDRSAQVINEIKALVDNHKQELNDLKDNNITELDNKANQIKEDIEELNNYDTSNWQKYRLTNDDGSVISMPVGTDMNKLGAGFYESSGFINDPLNDSGFYEVIVTESKNSRKVIYATHSYSNRMFVKTFHSGGSERDWKEITNKQSDTGWVTFDLINGAKSNTAYKNEGDVGFDCAYRTITNGSEVTKKLRINGTNLTPNQVIAQLPSNFAKNAQAFPVRVPNSSAGGYIVIRPSGRVNFYVSGDSSNWTETGYAYGECTWND